MVGVLWLCTDRGVVLLICHTCLCVVYLPCVCVTCVWVFLRGVLIVPLPKHRPQQRILWCYAMLCYA